MEMSGSRINQKEKHRIKIEKELWLFLATIKHDEYCQATLFKMTCSHSESNSNDHGDHGDHDGDDNDEIKEIYILYSEPDVWKIMFLVGVAMSSVVWCIFHCLTPRLLLTQC